LIIDFFGRQQRPVHLLVGVYVHAPLLASARPPLHRAEQAVVVTLERLFFLGHKHAHVHLAQNLFFSFKARLGVWPCALLRAPEARPRHATAPRRAANRWV
jgi:hypothetical protein